MKINFKNIAGKNYGLLKFLYNIINYKKEE